MNGVKNTCFFEGDLINLFHENSEVNDIELPDVMIVDPPRAGLHDHTIEDILEKSPRRIIYVSCNPATQARDAKEICKEGNSLVNLRPVDMFPHTPHVENVATFITRKL